MKRNLHCLFYVTLIVFLVGCGGGGGGGSGSSNTNGSGNNNNNLAPVTINFSSKPLNNVYYTKADLPQSIYIDYFPNDPQAKLNSFSVNFYFNERLFSISNLFKDLYPQSRRIVSLSSPFNRTSLSVLSLEKGSAPRIGVKFYSQTRLDGANLSPSVSFGVNKLAQKILYNSYSKKLYVLSTDYFIEVLDNIENNITYRTIPFNSKIFDADIYALEDKLYILFEDVQSGQGNQRKITVLKNESIIKEINLPYKPISIYVNAKKKYFYVLYDTGYFAYFSTQTDELQTDELEEVTPTTKILKLIPINSLKNEVIYIDELLNLNVFEILGDNNFALNQVKLSFYPHDIIFDSENRVLLLLDFKEGKIKKLIPQDCTSLCNDFIVSEVNTGAYPSKFFMSSNGKNIYLTYQDENAIKGNNHIEKWNYEGTLYKEDYFTSAVFPIYIQEVDKKLFILEDIWWELIDETGFIEVSITDDKGRTESSKVNFQVKREGVPIEQPRFVRSRP